MHVVSNVLIVYKPAMRNSGRLHDKLHSRMINGVGEHYFGFTNAYNAITRVNATYIAPLPLKLIAI